jgi:hypothetical protein
VRERPTVQGMSNATATLPCSLDMSGVVTAQLSHNPLSRRDRCRVYSSSNSTDVRLPPSSGPLRAAPCPREPASAGRPWCSRRVPPRPSPRWRSRQRHRQPELPARGESVEYHRLDLHSDRDEEDCDEPIGDWATTFADVLALIGLGRDQPSCECSNDRGQPFRFAMVASSVANTTAYTKSRITTPSSARAWAMSDWCTPTTLRPMKTPADSSPSATVCPTRASRRRPPRRAR